MLKPELIPDEVAEALIATLHGKPGLPYREAIAAAINAWPGMELEKVFVDEDYLILPVPKDS